MTFTQRIGSVIATVVLAFSSIAVAAPTASADTIGTCPYPYVCFYKGFTSFPAPTTNYWKRWQEKTTWWQSVPAYDAGTLTIVNTRNDDRTMIQYTVTTTGKVMTLCLRPGGTVIMAPTSKVTHIMIQDAATC